MSLENFAKTQPITDWTIWRAFVHTPVWTDGRRDGHMGHHTNQKYAYCGSGSHHLRKFIFMFHFFISWRLDRKVQLPVVHSASPVFAWLRASCQHRDKYYRLRCRSFWGPFIIRIGLLSTPEFIYRKISLRWALHYAVGRFKYIITSRLNSWSSHKTIRTNLRTTLISIFLPLFPLIFADFSLYIFISLFYYKNFKNVCKNCKRLQAIIWKL